MAKIHIVREQFSLNGTDYPRGTEISDELTLKAADAAGFLHHCLSTDRDATPAMEKPEPKKTEPKAP